MEKRGVEAKDEIDRASLGEPSSAAIRMLRAISAAAAATAMPTQELDAAAKALVTELRQANQPPEQVLLQIKQILAEAGLKPSHGPVDSAHAIGRHIGLYRSVIESSIRHYFTPEDGPASTSA